MRSVGGSGFPGKNDGEHANQSHGCFASGAMNKMKVVIAWSTYISAHRGLDFGDYLTSMQDAYIIARQARIKCTEGAQDTPQ